MKRLGLLIVTLTVILNLLGSPVWAAESSAGETSSAPAAVTDNSSGSAGDSSGGDGSMLDSIFNGVKEVKTSITSVVGFFQNFDPGKMVNDWIKKSLSDFLHPTVSWAEQNAAQYTYVNSSDPSFTWWKLLVILSLALMLYSTLHIAGQVMEGKRSAGDLIIAFGLILWLFASIWFTNWLVYARNHISYILLDWMVGQNWLASDTLQSTAQFIVPDLSKTIMANQDAVSAILAFLLGGFIILVFELVQAMVYGVWLLLEIGAPLFTTMTALASDFTPFVSYLSGLVRTLVASIVICVSWGLQGYVYQNQTDTTLQIIMQAIVVILTTVILWTFWWKFIETEILGMLSRPIQTVKGRLASSAGSKLQTAGKAAGILGAAAGLSGLAAMGYKAKTAGEAIADRGEEIKLQTGRTPARYNDVLSRMIERNLQPGRSQGSQGTAAAGKTGSKPFKTGFKGPFTRPPSLGEQPAGSKLKTPLERIGRNIEAMDDYFKEVPTPGGGLFFQYEGPLSNEIADQLEEKGVEIHSFQGHWAVGIQDETMAKYTAAKTLSNRTPYWVYPSEDNNDAKKDPEAEEAKHYVTVDPYRRTQIRTKPPQEGMKMGPWQKQPEKPKPKSSEEDSPEDSAAREE